MCNFSLCIKSGTGGHFDSDGCDVLMEEITAPFIPRIGETIRVGKDYKKYLVRDVVYTCHSGKNWIRVYVIPA